MTDPRAMQRMQDSIRRLGRDLIDYVEISLVHDDHTIKRYVGDSLIVQLHDAVMQGLEKSRSRGRSIPTPIDVSAFDVLTMFINKVHTLYDSFLVSQRRALGRYSSTKEIRLLIKFAGQQTDVAVVEKIFDAFLQWHNTIINFLNPPRQIHLAAPCPACGTRMVWRTASTGEKTQLPALSINGQFGCKCLHCNTIWGTDRLDHLALVINGTA